MTIKNSYPKHHQDKDLDSISYLIRGMKSYLNTKKVRFVYEREPKKSSAPISGSRASHVQRVYSFDFFPIFNSILFGCT